MYKKYHKYQISIPIESIATCTYIKLWKGTIHKVSSSNLVIFRQPFTFTRFQTIEWRHENNRCTLLLWPHFFLLERTYFMGDPKGDSKNCKKIIHIPILKETQPTIIWPIAVFTSSSVAFFRVTLCDHAQTFV